MAIKRVNHLKPSTQLLVKIGSALAHAIEGHGARAHPFDWTAFNALVYDDIELKDWLRAMTEDGFLPLPRHKPT